MIGVSLGAHISGFVGANVNGSIGRITGEAGGLQKLFPLIDVKRKEIVVIHLNSTERRPNSVKQALVRIRINKK